MTTRDIILAHPVRTAIGSYGGTLKGTPATDLGASVIRETLRRSGLAGDSIGTVVMGNVVQTGNRMNPARQAAIAAGLPVSIPAMSVNRVCGGSFMTNGAKPNPTSPARRCTASAPFTISSVKSLVVPQI